MDSRTRGLERQAAIGDTDAEARLLRARVRAGDLSRGKLRLAAYCGHEAARKLIEWLPCSVLSTANIRAQVEGRNVINIKALPEVVDTLSTDDWLTGLRTLAACLDGECGEREERCGCQRIKFVRLGSSSREFKCPCKGTGIRRVPWGGVESVMLRATRAAAELAQVELERRDSLLWDVTTQKYTRTEGTPVANSLFEQAVAAALPSRLALEAAACYQDEGGTLEALEAWRVAWVEADADGAGPVWVPSPRPSKARLDAIFQAAARVVGEPCGCLWSDGGALAAWALA